MPPGETLGRSKRLRRPTEFRTVFNHGRSVADDVLVVYGWVNPCGTGRLGLAVGKKLGSAPVRNRWKRVIREVYRRHQSEAQGLDIVVIPRRGVSCDFAAVADRLPRLIERLQRRLRARS